MSQFPKKFAPLKFAQYLATAIKDNYLMIAIITSHTQGKVKSINLPFGVGKTTFALWTSYIINAAPGTYKPNKPDFHNPFNGKDPVVIENWKKVLSLMVYNVYDCAMLLKPGSSRKLLGLWDDVPATAPAERGVPSALYKFKGYLTTTRPELACLLMTASNRAEVAAPLRKLALFEIIIARRGYYEVQKVQFFKNFRNPDKDKCRLTYLEEGKFPQLPDFVEQWYIEWRVREKRKLFPEIAEMLKRYVKIRREEIYEKAVLGKVVKSGGRYFVSIPAEVGKSLHLDHVEVKLPHKIKGGDSEE